MSYADKLEIERFVDATEITKFVYTEKNAALVKGHDLVKLSTFVLKTPPYFLDDLFRRGFDYSNFWNQALNAVKFEVG